MILKGKFLLIKKKEFIKKYVDFNSNVFDVGCSTGEFLTAINWKGQKYGSEISDFAINTAKKTGISFEKELSHFKSSLDLIILEVQFSMFPIHLFKLKCF